MQDKQDIESYQFNTPFTQNAFTHPLVPPTTPFCGAQTWTVSTSIDSSSTSTVASIVPVSLTGDKVRVDFSGYTFDENILNKEVTVTLTVNN